MFDVTRTREATILRRRTFRHVRRLTYARVVYYISHCSHKTGGRVRNSLLWPLDNGTSQVKTRHGLLVVTGMCCLGVKGVFPVTPQHIPHHGLHRFRIVVEYCLRCLVRNLDNPGLRTRRLWNFPVQGKGIVVRVDIGRPWLLWRSQIGCAC